MKQLTKEQMRAAEQAGCDEFRVSTIGGAVAAGIRAALALATEPEPALHEPPKRKGQWFVHFDDPAKWYGPTAKCIEHHEGQGCHSGAAVGWVIDEGDICQSIYLRIPPPPAGQDVKGWVCREPKQDEPWYDYVPTQPGAGILMDGGINDIPHDDPEIGKRRWIPPEPAPTPWPKLPVKVIVVEGRYYLLDGDGIHLDRAEMEAAALAANMLPRCAAWMERDAHGQALETLCPSMNEARRKRDALLAEIKAAAVKMPDGE